MYWTWRGIAAWDTARELPPAARVAGGASLALWAGDDHRRPLDRPYHLKRSATGLSRGARRA